MPDLPANISIDAALWEQMQDVAATNASDTQYRRHVGGQHDSDARRGQQDAVEGVNAAMEVKKHLREAERCRIRIESLEERVDKAEPESRKHRLLLLRLDEQRDALDYNERMVKMRLRRWNQAMSGIREHGCPTVEEWEAEEETYWRLRLTRQAALGWLERRTGIPRGELDALIQAGHIHREWVHAVGEHAIAGELARAEGVLADLHQKPAPLTRRKRLVLGLYRAAMWFGWRPAPLLEARADA